MLEGVTMTTLTIRLPEEDKALIKSYAELHGTSVAEFVRTSLLGLIEDEFDLRELEAAIATSDGVFYTHEEVKEMFGY
jgi:predicted transcriptional regulator